MVPLAMAIENLDELNREWQRAMRDGVVRGIIRGVDLGCREGIDEAKATRRWKNRTGETERQMRGWLDGAFTSGATGFLECLVPHASYLEEGTEPHDIWPKAPHGTPRKKLLKGQSAREITDIGTHRIALRWYDEAGDPVFRSMVHHPGTAPDGFMGRGVQKCERVILREVERGVAEAQRILDE